jgi:GT2 family glycosyltransferase
VARTKPKPLVVIPSYLTSEEGLGATRDAIESVRKTAGAGVEVLVVDDGSPERGLVDELENSQLEFEVHRKPENSGFSRTVNIGLRRALQQGRDAVLMNADVEITTPGWVRQFRATQDQQSQPAAVVGALLLYPTGLIQHGGVYFSLLTRTFDHLYKYGPADLPEALKKSVCPVTGALQYIRHSTLESVGLYDEKFFMGWEDVDYCLRVFAKGKQCIYNPNVRAFHFEYMFRGQPSPKIADWQAKSWIYLCDKWQDQNFSDLVPTIW